MKKRETLSEFNKRMAKERQPPRMKQLGDNPGAPDFEKMLRYAEQREEPTFKCPNCLDIGFIISTRTGPKATYGANPPPVTYSMKCPCQATKYKDFRPPEQERPI